MYTLQLLEGVKVHYNAVSNRSRYFLTSFIRDIANSYIDIGIKMELMFLIEKAIRPEPKWLQLSAQIFKEIIKDMDGLVDNYVRYENKTLKLTNFVFDKLYENKAELPLVIELLSSLNLKLLTSLKGKLISPLKKYICELELSQFDLTKSSMNALVQAFRVLFYFRK